MAALFSFSSLILVLLLFICTCTYLRGYKPTIFDSPGPAQQGQQPTASHPQPPNSIGGPGGGLTSRQNHSGLRGFCWKMSRIGERLSPYVSMSCILMAAHLLFIKE